MSTDTASTDRVPDRWLYGPARDLLLGCGLLYTALFAVFAFAGGEIRGVQPVALMAILVVLFSTPHYGATLLRVYERARDRHAYAYFAVWITAALLLVFVAAVYDEWIASIMLTVYLTWSPWHYSGQNYGIGVMLLRRAGVPLAGTIKRWVYASFILSYALTFVVLHEGTGGPVDSLVGQTGAGVRFLPIGIPVAVGQVSILGLGAAYALATAVAAARLLRVARPGDLAPLAALWLTQALWFSIPLAIRGLGLVAPVEPLDASLRPYYFLWIAVGHAVQYLWVTSYFARSDPSWRGAPRWYAKALVAGNAAWAVPVLLFAPDGLGRVSWDGGLALTVASLVNLHHFVLDGAIWKLRSTRIADVLIRSSRTAGSAVPAHALSTGSAWPRRLVWVGASVVMMLSVAEFYENYFYRPRAVMRGALEAASASLDRMAWIGRDSALLRLELGTEYAQAGDEAGAIREYTRSHALSPSAQALDGIGLSLLRQGRNQAALRHFHAAMALRPRSPGIMGHAARALIAMGDRAGARAMVARARAVDPAFVLERPSRGRRAAAPASAVAY